MAAITTSNNYETSNNIVNRIISVISSVMSRPKTQANADRYYEHEAYEQQRINKMGRDHIDKIKASIMI